MHAHDNTKQHVAITCGSDVSFPHAPDDLLWPAWVRVVGIQKATGLNLFVPGQVVRREEVHEIAVVINFVYIICLKKIFTMKHT